MFSSICEGAGFTYLAKAKPASVVTVPQQLGAQAPKFVGDIGAYIEAHGATAEVKRLLSNKVKKCQKCGKPNGFTLNACNACGDDLVSVPISTSNNVFMGFALGIEKGPFPLQVSIRYQDEHFLVVDDLLALAPLHFNVIPTSQHVPDWRFLLRAPTQGLELIQNMFAKCVEASKQFTSNQEWSKKTLRCPFDPQDVAAGFNYPPSQYQLHIQFILPAMIPFQYYQYLRGLHFTHKRFFPFNYVVECLKAARTDSLPSALLQEDTSVNDIIEYFCRTHGIDYDQIHGDFYKKFASLQLKYARWASSDFEGYVADIGGNPQFFYFDQKQNADVDVKALINEDKLALENYGRPYVDGRPTGSYYSFARDPKDITQW